MFVHEHQGTEGLRLGTGCQVPFGGEVIEEGLRLSLSEFLRVTLVMKQNELPAPVDLAGGCTGAVVAAHASEAYPVE